MLQHQAASDDICPDQETLAALAASKSMVVICSRHAAKSKYINEQIRQFKLRRGCERIIPVIVDGWPRDLDHECFPPALRFKYGPDGILTWEYEDLIGIDLNKKGEEAAQQKIAARAFGVHVDEVVRGCARKRIRRNGLRACLVTNLFAFAILLTTSIPDARQYLLANETFIDTAVRISVNSISAGAAQADKLKLPRGLTIGLLQRAEHKLDDYLVPDTSQLKYRKAWLLTEFARTYDMLGGTDGQKSRAQRAQRLIREISRDAQDDLEKLNSLATIYSMATSILAIHGALNEAIESYRDSVPIIARIAAADPEDLYQQRNLSLSYFTLGSLLFAKGDIDLALERYYQSLHLIAGIVSSHALNSGWQSDLADVYIAIGDALSSVGQFSEALEHYWRSEFILERLASAAGITRIWRSQLDYTRTRIAEVLGDEDCVIPNERSPYWRIGLDVTTVCPEHGQEKKPGGSHSN
jgi:tetratricopeptide (TPR) repeat protein